MPTRCPRGPAALAPLPPRRSARSCRRNAPQAALQTYRARLCSLQVRGSPRARRDVSALTDTATEPRRVNRVGERTHAKRACCCSSIRGLGTRRVEVQEEARCMMMWRMRTTEAEALATSRLALQADCGCECASMQPSETLWLVALCPSSVLCRARIGTYETNRKPAFPRKLRAGIDPHRG